MLSVTNEATVACALGSEDFIIFTRCIGMARVRRAIYWNKAGGIRRNVLAILKKYWSLVRRSTKTWYLKVPIKEGDVLSGFFKHPSLYISLILTHIKSHFWWPCFFYPPPVYSGPWTTRPRKENCIVSCPLWHDFTSRNGVFSQSCML